MILALAQKAHEELVRTGWAAFFDDGFAKTAEEVGASEQDVRQARRLMLDGYLLVEKQPGFFGATPRLLLFHEEIDRDEAYRQNTVRRHVLEEAGRIDTEGEFAIFRHDETDEYPAAQMFAAAQVLDYLGLVELGDRGLPAIFSLKITAAGYDALHDERLLRTKLPVMPTEDEEAHTPVAPDALRQVITSCEQMLERRGWTTALEDLRKADNEYADKDWVNAVRDYYSALESGLKYALHEEGANYGDKNALVRLAARAADAGLIPTNYQALFSFTDSIRSPRSHGAGPKRDIEVVEIGQAEALLIGNHVRILLLYLGNRPPIADKPATGVSAPHGIGRTGEDALA
jgi:HEPN domain-containing protein